MGDWKCSHSPAVHGFYCYGRKGRPTLRDNHSSLLYPPSGLSLPKAQTRTMTIKSLLVIRLRAHPQWYSKGFSNNTKLGTFSYLKPINGSPWHDSQGHALSLHCAPFLLPWPYVHWWSCPVLTFILSLLLSLHLSLVQPCPHTHPFLQPHRTTFNSSKPLCFYLWTLAFIDSSTLCLSYPLAE